MMIKKIIKKLQDFIRHAGKRRNTLDTAAADGVAPEAIASTTALLNDNSAEVLSASDASEHFNLPTLVQMLRRRVRDFNQNAQKRRNILKIIFAAIEQQQPFSWEDIVDRVENMEMEGLPIRRVILGYLKVIFQGNGFIVEKSQREKRANKKMSLRENINSEDAFIRAYEQGVTFKLHQLVGKFFGKKQELSASLLAKILGLRKDEEKLSYCQSLLTAAEDISAEVLSALTAAEDISAEVLSTSDASEHSNLPTLVQMLRGEVRHFTQNAQKRRNILKIIFAAIEQQQPFSWEDIVERVANMETKGPPKRPVILGYLKVIFQGDGFTVEKSQGGKRANRKMFLRENINSEDAFIRSYEQNVAFKLHQLVGQFFGKKQELSASLLAEILGLQKDEERLAYCQSLLTAAEGMSVEKIAQIRMR